MSQIFSSRWFLVAVLGVPMLAACSKDACFPASKGKQYQINIVELWDANSQFPGGQTTSPCPTDLDLKSGGSFVVRVDGFDPDSVGCTCGTGPAVQAPNGWTWEDGAGAECGGNFFELRTNAVDGACSGDVQISIEASRVPTGAEVPGQPAAAHLQRSFMPRTPGCGLGASLH